MPVLESKLVKKLEVSGLFLLPGVNLSNYLVYEAPVVLYGNCSVSACRIGAFSYVNAMSTLTCCEIGRYCSLASDLDLGMPRHRLDKITTSSVFYNEFKPLTPYTGGQTRPLEETARCRITIGNDVWIGAHVAAPANHDLSIGTGAVVGAGAVITKSIPPYAIAAGNPARIIRMRFRDEICQDLLESRWWNYNLPLYMSKVRDLPIEGPKAFLSIFKDLKQEMPKIDGTKFTLIPKSAAEVQLHKQQGG